MAFRGRATGPKDPPESKRIKLPVGSLISNAVASLLDDPTDMSKKRQWSTARRRAANGYGKTTESMLSSPAIYQGIYPCGNAVSTRQTSAGQCGALSHDADSRSNDKNKRRRKTNLTTEEKLIIISELLMMQLDEADATSPAAPPVATMNLIARTRTQFASKEKRLQKAIDAIAINHDVAGVTIARVWRDYLEQKANGVSMPNMKPKRRSGRPVELSPLKRGAIIASSQKRRYKTTVRNVARDANVDSHIIIPLTSVWRYRNRMGYKKHNEYHKTLLSLTNKIKRLSWAIDEVEVSLHPQTGAYSYRFKDLKKRGFFDEKWFETQTKGKIYRRDEDPILPPPALKNKLHPPKVMISAGFAYPQPKTNGEYFNGCVGVYPFVERVQAKRDSRNRVAGTFETKPVSVTAQVYFDSMTQQGGVMDQIQQQTAGLDLDVIVFNLDSATPHTGDNNIARLNAIGAALPIPIQFRLQPPQSPEFNLLDLSIWYSLAKKAEYIVGNHRNIDDIIANVTAAYNDYSNDTLLRMYALYYVVMREVLKAHGSNNFKIPHTGIRARQLNALLPTEDRMVEPDVYANAVASLADMRARAQALEVEAQREKTQKILNRRIART